MLNPLNLLSKIIKSNNQKELDRITKIVEKINALETEMQSYKDENFPIKTEEFRKRLNDCEDFDNIIPEAFALVREASNRVIGERHYDVQLHVDMKSGLKFKSNILNIKSEVESPEISNLNYDENVLKSIAYNSNCKFVHINDIKTFFNSFSINENNKIVKNRYNVFTFQKYWLILKILK